MADMETDEQKGFENRDDIMDSILASRQDDLEQEVVDGGGEFVEDDDQDKDAQKDEVDPADDAVADDDKDAEDIADEEELIDLVVDGEKKSLKVSEVVSIAQKNMAADKRLQDAEATKKKAEEHLKTVQDLPKVDNEPDKLDEDLNEAIAEKRTAYLHAMNYGEADEQEAAMIEYEKLVRGSGDQKTDTKDLEERITANIKQKLTGEQINDRFDLPPEKGGFSDIRSNTRLMKMCWNEIQDAIEGGADGSKWETYRDIAIDVRNEFIGEAKPDKPASDKALEEKKMRKKRKVDNLKTISEKSGSSLKNENPISSEGLRGDVVSTMAKGRPGQQNY